MMNHMLLYGLAEIANLSIETDKRLEKIKEDWWATCNLPRKQKKKERKRLSQLWDILQFAKVKFTF